MKLESYVLDVLKSDSWMLTLEICDEVVTKVVEKQDWGLVSFLIAFFSVKYAEAWFRFNSYAAVTVALSSLVENKQVKRRQRIEPPEALEDRGGRRRFEYQLIESGFRSRKKQSFRLISQT